MVPHATEKENSSLLKQGEFIKQLRLKADLTQSELAEKIGRNRLTISLIEKGERGVTLLMLNRIIDASAPLITPTIKFDLFEELAIESFSNLHETEKEIALEKEVEKLKEQILKLTEAFLK